MKLHLPKQLFTALLAALTLAAPAALTLGSVAQGDDATHWNITSSAYTTTETTISNGTTFYLGNGTSDGNGQGNADTKFESGKFTIKNGGKLYIHGWTTKDLTINADPKLEIASEIELQSGGTLHMQDGSYYFSNTVAVSGTVNIKSEWDKGHVFNALTGDASSIINMSGHSSWATTFALQGEGGYAGRINLTGGSSGGKTSLAINSASALASTAAINLSGQYTNLAMNTASQTLSSIAGNGTIMLANTTTLGGSAVSSELTISNTAASSDVFSGTIDSGITVKVADGSYQTFGGVTNNGTLTFEKGSNVTLNKTITGTGTVNLNGAVTIGSLDGFQYEVLDGTLNGEGGDHGFRTGNVQYSLVAGANTTGTDFSVTLGGTDITDKLSKADNALEYVFSTTRTIYEILGTHTETVVYDGVNGESATATGFELASGTTLQLNSSLAGSVTDGISIADSATATIKVVKTGETTPSLSSSSVKLGTSSAVDYVVDGGTLNLYSGSGTNSLSVTNNGVVNVNGANHVLGSTDKRVLVALGEGGNISFINGGSGGAAHMNVTVTGTGILTGSWQGDHLNVQGTITGEQGSTLQLAQRSGSTNTWTISSTISGNLAMTSTALVTLSGTNTYTGGTVIDAGELRTQNTSALGTGAVELNNSGVLRVFNALAISELNSTSATTVVTTGTGAATLTVSAGEFAGALKDFVAHSNFKGVAEGAHALSLVKTGSGTLTLSGANTYTGSTTVSGGSLILAGSSTLGTGQITLESGTELELQSTGNTIANSITDAGTLVIANGGNATVDSNTLGGSKINTNIRIEDGGTLTFTGSGSDNLNYGNNSRTIYLEGNAELDFGASRQTMGHWTVDMTGGVVSGTNSTASLDFHNSASLKAHAAKNVSAENPTISSISANIRSKDGGTLSVTVDENAQLNMSGQLTLNRPTEKLGAGKLLVNGGTGITQNISGEFTISAGSVEFNGASISVGTFNNNAALTVSGGTANMNGTVTNNGTITVSGGTATFANTLSMGTGAALTVSGGTANVNGSFNVTGTGVQISQSGNGELNLTGSVSVAEGAAATLSGAITLGHTITNDGSLTLDGTIYLTGDIETGYNRVSGQNTESSYVMLDAEGAASTNDNGFLQTKGVSYYLTQSSDGVTNAVNTLDNNFATNTAGNKVVYHGTTSYEVGTDSKGLYFSTGNIIGTQFYINTGSVTVDSLVQERATGYTLQGGSMIITDGSVSASAITCDGSKYTTTSGTTGIITVGAGAELLLDTMPGGASLLNLLKGEGMVNAESAGRLVVTTEQNLGGSPVTTYQGKLEIVGAKLTIGSGQNNTNTLSSLSEIILNDGGNIFYNGKDDGAASVMDFQKITVESGTGEFHLEDSGGDGNSNNTIQFGEIAVAAEATMLLTSKWQDSAYYVDKLTGAGEFHAKSATDSGLNRQLTVNNLADFSGDLVFTNADAGFAAVTVNTGSSEVNFRSLSVNDVQGFTFNVQANTTIGLLSATSGTVDVSENKTLTLGGGTAEAQKQHSIGTLSAASAGVTLGDYATLTLGGGTAEAQKQHSIGTLSGAAAGVTLGDYATLTLGGGTAEAQKQHSIGTLTGGTGSYVNLAQHSVLNTITTASGVTLTGSGTYKLASNTKAMTTGVTLDSAWTGTVVMHEVTGIQNQLNTILNDLTNGTSSKVQLSGVNAWLSTQSTDRSILLENLGDGTAALTLNNGSTHGGGTMTAAFAGSVGGSGDIVFYWNTDSSSTTQRHLFSGDTSTWSGKFINENSNTMALLVEFDQQGSVFSSTVDGGGIVNKNAATTNDDKTGGKLTVKFNNSGNIDFYGTVSKTEGASETEIEVAQGKVTLHKQVTVDGATVAQNATAKVNSTLTAGTVSNAGQIKLGESATVTGGSMNKVQMSSTGITGTAQDGSSSIANADIEIAQLAQDASFTIQDMTLTNTSITAASVNIEDSKVSGNVVLNVVKPTEAITAPNVGQSGTEGKIRFSYGLALENNSSSLTLNMEVPQAILPSESGLYTLTITLNGFAEDFDFNKIASQVVFGADSWLGQALTGASTSVMVDGETISAGAAAAQSSGAPSVSYNATSASDGNVGSLVITINGLNVPEPATSALSLLALAALAARRRRK